MKKTIIPFLFVAIASTQINAQTGINTPNPGSTLDVNGSLAAQYRAVTATAYSMNETDFHVSYNGTANSIFTLPTAISGIGNFKGRLYTIKNNTAFTVTVNPSGSETISGNTSIALTANQSIQIINTGLTGAAATWEVIARNNTGTGVGCVPDYVFATLATKQMQVTLNNRINFNSVKSSSGTGITVNNGVFTLEAGKTYELEANLFATDFFNNSTFLQAAWKNTADNTVLLGSTVAEIYSVGYTTTFNSEMPVSKAIITPTTNMTVALDITGANAYANINNNQSYAMVRQLNSCGGGGTATPGTTYNGSTSVVLNGNSFERAALIGDVTAAANNNTVTVTGLQNRPVSSITPTSNDLLSYDGTNWTPLPSSSLGIPKQVLSVSVPGNQNIFGSSQILQFTVENYDPNNAWSNNEYTVPVGQGGTYNLNVHLSNLHNPVGNSGNFWVMIQIEKSVDGGSNYNKVSSDIRTSSGLDGDNSIGLFWTGNMNVNDKLRVRIQYSGNTSNTVQLGNLALTRL
jgi:hypothetical protein